MTYPTLEKQYGEVFNDLPFVFRMMNNYNFNNIEGECFMMDTSDRIYAAIFNETVKLNKELFDDSSEINMTTKYFDEGEFFCTMTLVLSEKGRALYTLYQL